MNGSNLWILRLALLAILQLALLLFPLAAANALPQCSGLDYQIVAEHDRADQTSDTQHASQSADAHAADHSHDVPNAPPVAVSLVGKPRNCWRQAERPTTPVARPSDIDRPPRHGALA